MYPDLAAFNCLYSGLCQWTDLYIPLVRKIRLDRDAGTITVPDLVFHWFDFFYQTLGLQLGNDGFSCLIAVKAGELTAVGVYFSIRCQDIYHLKVMS